MAVHLTLHEARRIAVRAQLLDAARPDDALNVVRQLTFVQLEPTAAVAPTADLVMWSRLGDGYAPGDLESERFFELGLLVRPMEDLALFRAEFAVAPVYERAQRWVADNDPFRADVIELLEAEGPLTAKEVPDTSVVAWQSSGWNANRNSTMMLELLESMGEVAVSGRRGRDRLWDLADRVHHSDIPTIPLDEARRVRNERRLRAQGVVPLATPDLPAETTRIGDAGLDATIEGVRGKWRVDAAALDRPFEGRTALLSPFDGLIRDRKRMLQLWQFDYSLEMYKPATARRWGYYALPILHGDSLVGKLDVTADRAAGVLRVNALHEDHPFDSATRDSVDAELDDLARWLDLRLLR
jgi:uncharacterized protein